MLWPKIGNYHALTGQDNQEIRFGRMRVYKVNQVIGGGIGVGAVGVDLVVG